MKAVYIRSIRNQESLIRHKEILEKLERCGLVQNKLIESNINIISVSLFAFNKFYSIISISWSISQSRYSQSFRIRFASILWNSSRQYRLKFPRGMSRSLHMRFLLIPLSDNNSLIFRCKCCMLNYSFLEQIISVL